ncbi:hypothetical protein SDC9_71440 [bioreactor metagenome]|uniref:Uncharacterized protein n=1 Tax=bioreactor metagenome TaxID=1076179 RepID=A0A644YAL9_9ZZZZ
MRVVRRLLPGIRPQLLRRGTDDDLSRGSVQNQHVATGNRAHGAFHAEYGGNAVAARNNGGVRGNASGLRNDSGDHGAVQRRRV